MMYRLKNVEASQFDPELLPWPEGVTASEESSTGYLFVGERRVEIRPGDYVIPGRWFPFFMAQAEFESLYEPSE